MSLSTMTNDLARPGTKQFPEAVALENVPRESSATKSRSQKAYDAIAKFIPTEVLAPFLMAMQLIKDGDLAVRPEAVYWGFVVGTPFLLILFEYAKSAESDVAWPFKRQVFWRGIVAMVAFAVWSLSVPGNPYQQAIGGIAVAGLLAVLVSPILTAVDAIVLRLLKPKE